MFFGKRAFVSMRRNTGRSCLLFLLVLILGSMISAAISIGQATETTKQNLIESIFPVAMIRFNSEVYKELSEETDFVGTGALLALVREITDLPYVKSYDFFTDIHLNSLLEPYEPQSDEYELMQGGMWNRGREVFGEFFSLRGVQNPDVIDIEQNVIELVSGRVFTNDEVEGYSNVAIISQEIATLNSLTIGSIIPFRHIIYTNDTEMTMWGENDFFEDDIFLDESHNLEVVGIFNPTLLPAHDNPWLNQWIIREKQNRIYVPISFVERIIDASYEAWHEKALEGSGEIKSEPIWLENMFILHSPDYFPEFRTAVENKLPSYFNVIDSEDSLRPIFSALETIRQLNVGIVWGTIGATLITLTLLILLFLRERKYEMGVFIALGEKKRNISLQIILEHLVIAIMGIIVALFVGNMVSSILSEGLLRDNIMIQQEIYRVDIWDGLISPLISNEISADVVLDNYDISMNLVTVISFFLVGLGTTIIATIIPIVYVLRLDLRKIMM